MRSALVIALAVLLAACASVLGIRPTSQAHTFEHRAHVTKGINCKTCHADIQNAGDEGPLHLPNSQKCKECHQKPHDERDCGTCHGEAYVRGGAELARQHLKFEHKKHLKASGVNGDCVHCHDDVGLEKPETLRPKMAQCFSCHEHEKQWSIRDCDGCHVDLESEKSLPATHLVHEGDWIREHGARAASARDLCSTCHSEKSCASCHGVGTVPALPSRLAFDDVRLSGLHRAGFRARHADEARADPGLCTTCHSQQSCNECHTKKNVAPGSAIRSPHPQGWVGIGKGGGDHGVQARLDPVACASCHGGAGEQLCIGCHKVGGPGGNPHGRGFTSKKDKLRDVPCRQCHGAGP